ncbi:MAG: DUF1737 domain-containing protein [Paracoccaceae bacterium]
MKIYRFLTEDDTSSFCHIVSEALSKGWALHGGPTYAYDAARGVMPDDRVTLRQMSL